MGQQSMRKIISPSNYSSNINQYLEFQPTNQSTDSTFFPNLSHFLIKKPLNNNFLAMQKELMQMYALGINFWKIPLAQNEEFLSELENLIRSEIVSERLLGNPLKRELFNFVYKVVQIIKEASPFLEANMLKKDENTVSGSIPKLVIFKMV